MDPPSFACYPLDNHARQLNSHIKTLTVDEFVDQLQDGDLIFSRSDEFTGHLIQKSGHCIWNHVAMCLYKYWCEATNDDTLYHGEEIEQHNAATGVKIWNMRAGLKHAFQKNTSMRLLFGVSRFSAPSSACIQNMWAFWKREQGKPYTPTYWPLLFSWLDSWSSITNTFCCWRGAQEDDGRNEEGQWPVFKNQATTDSYFCSQIIVECLQQCQVMIPETWTQTPATEWTVANLANTQFRLKNNLRNNFKYAEIEFFHVTLG